MSASVLVPPPSLAPAAFRVPVCALAEFLDKLIRRVGVECLVEHVEGLARYLRLHGADCCFSWC